MPLPHGAAEPLATEMIDVSLEGDQEDTNASQLPEWDAWAASTNKRQIRTGRLFFGSHERLRCQSLALGNEHVLAFAPDRSECNAHCVGACVIA